jgi:hypothetical protein
MAKQIINIGTVANDGTGDPLRTAFDKANDNFTELYGAGSLSLASDIITFTKADGTTSTINISAYLDEDARAISSGTLNAGTGIVTFTRDDASTFTLDLSALLDDTNLVTSVNGQTGAVTLVLDDVIADDSITEVKLDASNTPIDDQVLTYDSSTGGFTWRSDYYPSVDDTTIEFNGSIELSIVDNVDLPGTGKVGIPKGTTAQRPGSPSAGMFRYNTETGEFEGYTTEWGAIGGGGATIYVDTFTGDGSTVAFTASQSIDIENNTQIYIDGVYQSKSNYSTSGTTVTFTTAPPNGSAIEMIHVKAVALTTVADDSISYEKIDDEFKTSDVLTAGATVDVDFDAAQIFTLTPNQNTTLNITNPKVGITKSVIMTGAGGSYTLAFTVGGASGTFNKIAGDYDDTSSTKNFIQIICVSATEFWYSISQIAS